MIRQFCLTFLLALGLAPLDPALAEAQLCTEAPGRSEPATMSTQDWRAMAEISFHLGAEPMGDAVHWALIEALRPMSGFETGRLDAAEWNARYRSGTALAEHMRQMTGWRPWIAEACRLLDDLGFEDEGPAMLRQSWYTDRITTMRRALDSAIQQGEVRLSRMERYASFLGAAERSYGSRSQVPGMGPVPAQVAGPAQRLASQWRVAIADLRFVRQNLPLAEDPADPSYIAMLDTAQKRLAEIDGRALSLLANRLPQNEMDRLTRGEHLYDACPIEDGGRYFLTGGAGTNSVLASATIGAKSGHGMVGTAMKVGSLSVLQRLARGEISDNVPSLLKVLKPHITFRFAKIGFGRWTISNGAGQNQQFYLDSANNPGGNFPLFFSEHAAGGNLKFSGQSWRCYANPMGGYRFSNAFLGEGRALTYVADQKPMQMLPHTGPSMLLQGWALIEIQ